MNGSRQLIRRPKRTLGALALGLCAIGVAVGSGADFSAQTADGVSTFSAGSLSMENSKNGAAIFSATNMKPGGAAQTGVVDIKNTGSIDGVFKLTRDRLTNTDAGAPNPSPFATKVNVWVVDCGKFSTRDGATQATPTCGDADDSTLYNGTLAGQTTAVSLGTFQPEEQHRYQFATMLDSSAGNEYARRLQRALRVRRRPDALSMRRLLVSGALLALVSLGALILAPALLGYQRYVIEGGSMGGAVPRGSIAYEEVVPAGRIRVGDVITYRPPGAQRLVTHRVTWIGHDRRGARLYRTRGDASPAPDPWRFRLAAPTQARLAFHVPVAGYALAALSIRAVRMAVIGGPALAIAAAAFAGVWPWPAAARWAAAAGGRRRRTLSFG